MLYKYDEQELISTINSNINYVINFSQEQADQCAAPIRAALECAIKLFWLKKYNKVPVWIERGKEEFNLYKATVDERFANYFDKLIISDTHIIRKICNDTVHCGTHLTLVYAKELLARLERCIKAIEVVIQTRIIMTLHVTSIKKDIVQTKTQISQEGNMKIDKEMQFIIKNQIACYDQNKDEFYYSTMNSTRFRKSGYMAFDSQGNNIGIVFMSDDERTARYGNAEIMFLKRYNAIYGKWRIIKNRGQYLPYSTLEEVLKRDGQYVLVTDERQRKL